jgi:enterochelin esterase-like enzyme
MYNLLLAGANAQLMKDNPTLVQAILSADQTQTTSAGTSSGSTQAQTTGTQALQDLQNIDLLTMSPTTIASVLQQYLQSKNSATQSTSGSQVNQSV